VVTCGGGVLELGGGQLDFATPWFVWPIERLVAAERAPQQVAAE
jgi:hypothetical protein